MSVPIPESHKNLLEEPLVAELATVLPDGRPQVHPVWVDYEGNVLRVNSARGRKKDENMRERDYATLLLIRPDDPYYWMEVRGRVTEVIEGEKAERHIDKLAYKYLGKESYPFRSDEEVRVMYKIEPDRILTSGNGS